MNTRYLFIYFTSLHGADVNLVFAQFFVPVLLLFAQRARAQHFGRQCRRLPNDSVTTPRQLHVETFAFISSGPRSVAGASEALD